MPRCFGGRAIWIEYGLIDTHFFGNDLDVQHTDEIGVSLGTDRHASSTRFVRVGTNDLDAPKAKGFDGSLAFRF